MKNRVDMEQDYRRGVMCRVLLCCLFFLLCFASLTHHIFLLQVTKNKKMDSVVQKRIGRSDKIQGTRGQIFDRNGTLLVGNLITQRVLSEPKRILPEDLDEVIGVLATGLDMDKEQLRARFDKILNIPVEASFTCKLSRENAEILSLWNLSALRVKPPMWPQTQYQITLCPDQCSEQEMARTLQQISPLVGLSVYELQAIIKKEREKCREITVKNNVDYSKALALRDDLAALETRLRAKKDRKRHVVATRLVEDSVRFYPQKQMLSNLLGFLNPDKADKQGRSIGYSGIEKLFDEEMKPTPGKVIFSKDARGKLMIALDDITEVPAKNGADIYLTVEAPIQQFAEEELAKMVEKFNPDRAYAVMMNPRTGAIMALAQYPTFDPNDRSSCKNPCGFQNHCFVEAFEPGSIMKSLPISYALEKRTTSLDKCYYCEGGRWYYMGKTLRDTHHNMNLTTSDILMVSSNIGTAKIAMELNEGNLYNAFKAYCLGVPTHIGFYPAQAKAKYIGAETKGMFRALEKWDSLSVTRFPIGQGISCSPMQLLQAYGAIANHGTMMQPYIVEKVVDGDNSLCSVPKVKGHPISPATSEKVTSALIRVVKEKEGTGTKARIDGFTVAGKTGSAQIWLGNCYAEKQFNSSFVGYVPAYDPKFVLIVTARNVRAHGGTVCGPVFKAIAQRTLNYLEVLPEQPEATDTRSTVNAK